MGAEAGTSPARPYPPKPTAAMSSPPEVVTDLVIRARNGDKLAWDALVERYAPLIWSI